jgi:hypothetical protein
MEKHINKKIDDYMCKFKEQVVQKASEWNLSEDSSCRNLIQFVVDYEPIVIEPTDLVNHRTRTKTFVPMHDRCLAKRSCQAQCSRRRKKGSEFCGTHIKGTAFGVCTGTVDPPDKQIEIWQQDFRGIIYYIDAQNNVYDTSDVLRGVHFPKIIAKYAFDGTNYYIPEYQTTHK